jgi:predicted transcriptional regulator
VQTASIYGRHIDLTLDGTIGGNSRNLAESMGSGEVRYNAGAYVVAPPSRVNGNEYKVISGDFSRLPKIEPRDLLDFAGNQDIIYNPPPRVPRRALALLNGAGVEKYRSRSEAEAAIVLSLVNVGFSFDGVLDLYSRNTGAGKYAAIYANNPQGAFQWLRHTYNEATNYHGHESKARQTACAAVEWAQSKPWPGRSGALMQVMYIAFAEVAYRAGRLEVAASCRTMAEMTGTSKVTASRLLHRLTTAKLIEPTVPNAGESARIYRLKFDMQTLYTSSQGKFLGSVSLLQHDAFRRGRGRNGLGKAAGQIYSLLKSEGMTLEELVTRTGRDKRTVSKNLYRMAKITDRKTGEVISMVEFSTSEQRWRALEVDLDLIARIVGTDGAGVKQKRLHEQERRAHSLSLLMGRGIKQ